MKQPVLEIITIKFFYNQFDEEKAEQEITEVETYLQNTGLKHDIYNIDDGEIMVDLFNVDPQDVTTKLLEMKVR